MDKYLSLIQVIAGGLLTIVGGFVANVLIQRRNRNYERRELKRQKLEQLYQYSCAVQASVGQLVVFWATFAVTKATDQSGEDGKSAMENLKLIALFYHPEIGNEVRRVDERLEEFYASISRYAEAALEKRGPVPGLFKEAVNDPAEAVRAAHQSLIEAAARLAHRYV